MSLSSFISRCSKDPSYFPRRIYWEVLHALPEHDVVAATRHGTMIFSSQDLHIGRALYLARDCDYEDIEAAARILATVEKNGPCGTVIDVGANIGTVCIPFVRNGYFTRALAFEPGPGNFSYLLKNIGTNGLEKKIDAFQMALSSVEGEKPLLLCAENNGDHRIALESEDNILFDFEPRREKITVAVRTLDGFLAERRIAPADIGLLWMDTQGHEFQVLKGAESLVQSGVPLVTEIWPYSLKRNPGQCAEFFGMLQKHYSRFYDLKSPRAASRSTQEIHSLLDLKGDSYACTNILLLK